ncbi:MAG: phospholipase D-like domain-containing protein [Pseudomonadota bacterium]
MTLFQPGENCWRVARAETCDVLIDAENYFRSVREAMLGAKERIILIGWDFDARVKMYDTQGDVEGPLEIGEYLDWLVDRNPDLHIHILQWNLGALKLAKRGRTLLKAAKWLANDRIQLKLDDDHPEGAAQHEKLIVVDRNIAFCGGIDITEDRWDTRAHNDTEERRAQPAGHDAGPWHDVSTRLTGEVALALADHAEHRWEHAVGDKPHEVTEGSPELTSQAERPAAIVGVEVAIARTRGESDKVAEVREIEALYCDIIAAARDAIYIETQYLTARSVVRSLATRLSEEEGPEIVLVMPASADGWLESQFMDTTRARCVEALRAVDRFDRLQVYHPVAEHGTDIYVHAKILIVDRRFLRIGSSNLSNRSMGFDSECDICVDATLAGNQDAIARSIEHLRNDLIAEHVGSDAKSVARSLDKTRSIIATINAASKVGRQLRVYQTPELNAVQEWLADNDILDPASADDDWPSITF